MKKIIKIEIALSKNYKWIARQPYGGWTAFEKKPKIVKDESDGSEYWAVQENELDITSYGVSWGDWKKSLTKI